MKALPPRERLESVRDREGSSGSISRENQGLNDIARSLSESPRNKDACSFGSLQRNVKLESTAENRVYCSSQVLEEVMSMLDKFSQQNFEFWHSFNDNY